MGRQALEKLTPWRASNIIYMMNSEELFQGRLRISSDTFRNAKMNKLSSW
jgi:hypothetical protein